MDSLKLQTSAWLASSVPKEKAVIPSLSNRWCETLVCQGRGCICSNRAVVHDIRGEQSCWPVELGST